MATKPKIRYDRQLLEEICERDKCIVDFDKIDKYNRDVKIEFVCSCGKSHSKTFRMMYCNAGAFCNKCTLDISLKKIEKHCLDVYGVKNAFQSEEVKTRIKQTNKVKYNCEYPQQSSLLRNKSYETCMRNHGVKHPAQNSEIQNKMMSTTFYRFGVKHNSQCAQIKQQKMQTCLKHFGVKHPFQSDKIRNKAKETCIQTYGVGHPMHDAEISERCSQNSYKLKSFTFPCGNTIQVQGYEPFLLDILVKEEYTLADIITKRTDVPVIWYQYNNKESRYYCDAYIPKTNTIYEVKSTWTYKKDIDKNKIKQQACLDAGYNFEFYVFNTKGIRQNVE